MSKIRKNLDDFFEYGIDTSNRILYMGSAEYDWDGDETGTDFRMAEKLIKGLMILDIAAPKGDKPITIMMNNIGGFVYHSLAIYDAIASTKNYVTIICLGHCMSAATIILQAADKRVVSENCSLMIHDGTDGYIGHTQNFIRTAEETKRLVKLIDNIYLKRIKNKNPDFTDKKIRKLLEFDTYLTSEQAVRLGLADEILKNGKTKQYIY